MDQKFYMEPHCWIFVEKNTGEQFKVVSIDKEWVRLIPLKEGPYVELPSVDFFKELIGGIYHRFSYEYTSNIALVARILESIEAGSTPEPVEPIYFRHFKGNFYQFLKYVVDESDEGEEPDMIEYCNIAVNPTEETHIYHRYPSEFLGYVHRNGFWEPRFSNCIFEIV